MRWPACRLPYASGDYASYAYLPDVREVKSQLFEALGAGSWQPTVVVLYTPTVYLGGEHLCTNLEVTNYWTSGVIDRLHQEETRQDPAQGLRPTSKDRV